LERMAAAMGTELTLYTFANSHYCEKARWALDRAGLSYREVAWAPGPHILFARRLAPQTTVPILRTREGCIQGSGAILDWIERTRSSIWPAPADRAGREIEAHADAVTGVAVRRFTYTILLAHAPGQMAQDLFRPVAAWQKPLAYLMWPLTRRAIRRGFRASARDLADARDALERELAALDERLADGRRFLLDEGFARVDLALASLLAPLARPAEHPVYPRFTPVAAFRDAIAPWAARPSLRWVRALYRDFRAPQV